MPHRRSPSPTATALLAAVPVLLAACAPTQTGDARSPVSVFAASSLTEGFSDLEHAFEAQHPGLDIQLTFAGSQVLRLQLEHGADADLFASANRSHMQALAAAGLVSDSRIFARNELVVIVPRDNPARIERFTDLLHANRLVIGTDSVPVGRYTQRVIARAGKRLGDGFANELQRRIVSRENNVRLVRAKVELGEADAAIVYTTDARATDTVRALPIPPELNTRVSYPIGQLSDAPHPEGARKFMAFVLSDAGQRILAEHGFLTGSP